MPTEPVRVAVVGSGPAGFYAAAALLAADPPAEVDMLERLPTPWGLVRLGVAPDHPNIKSVSKAFERTASQPGFRFFGNVEVGRDVTHEELTRLYDGVVYAVGAQTDRRLGIPGEDLPGSWAATEFVAWYNGHPDFQHLEFDLSHERAVVIGNGNVALDVARMLALTPDELAATDTTDPAIEAINDAGIREIVVARPARPRAGGLDAGRARRARRARGRRRDRRPGRARARRRQARPSSPPRRRRCAGTSIILRELRGPHPGRQAARDQAALLRVARSRSWATDGSRRSSSPATSSSRGGPCRPTSARRSSAGSSSAASATAACPCPASRSTSETGTVPNVGGRVEPGVYCAGWIKRGPSGVIGTNKKDASETVQLLLQDAAAGLLSRSAAESLEQLLEERGVEAVLYRGWEAIDLAERSAGEPHGRPRVKLSSWDELLAAARAGLAPHG